MTKSDEPIDWTPTPRLGEDKKGYASLGNKIKLLKQVSHEAVIGQEYEIGLIRETYDGDGVNTSKKMMKAEPQGLEPADVEPRDSNGRTPLEAFEQEFGGIKGVYVISDPYHTTRETLGRIIGYSSGGSVKVELYATGEWHGQESYTPDKSNVQDVKVYKPQLVLGEWGWWSGKYYKLSPAKGNEKLTRLLD